MVMKTKDQGTEKNMRDFFRVEKIAKKALLDKINVENFTDENYPRFKKYMLDVKEHYKNSNACLSDVVTDLSPLELKLLGDNEPFDYVYLDDCEESKTFVNSDIMKLIVKTRKYPDQEKAFEILSKYDKANRFPKIYFSEDYIDVFESYLAQLYKELDFGFADVDDDFFRFHPSFILFIRDNFDIVFDRDSLKKDGKLLCNYLNMSKAGRDLLSLSNSLQFKLM